MTTTALEIDLTRGSWTSNIIFPTLFGHPDFSRADNQDYTKWVMVGLDLDVPPKILKEVKKVAKEKTLYEVFHVVNQIITEWIKVKKRYGGKALVSDLVEALIENCFESFGEAITAAFIEALDSKSDQNGEVHSSSLRRNSSNNINDQTDDPPPRRQQRRTSEVQVTPILPLMQIKLENLSDIEDDIADKPHKKLSSLSAYTDHRSSRSAAAKAMTFAHHDHDHSKQTEKHYRKRRRDLSRSSSNDQGKGKHRHRSRSRNRDRDCHQDDRYYRRQSKYDFDKDGFTRFHLAVKQNKMRSVLDLIHDHHINVNERAKDLHNNTALHLAAWNIPNRDDAIAMIRLLIRNGAEVEAKNSNNAIFIEGLFNPEVQHISPMTPSQFHDLVTLLVNLGHTNILLTPSGNNYDFVIHRAMRRSIMGTETIKFLHSNGIGLNSQSAEENALLYYAIVGGRDLEIVKCLIHFGADWRHVNKNYCNLLHVAAQYRNLTAFKYLIGLKPQFSKCKNKDGLTPVGILKKYYPEDEKILKRVEGLVW